MKSTQEKKAIGTYRKDRDKTKNVKLNPIIVDGIKVVKWDCPKEIKNKSAWNDTVKPLLLLGLVFEQDKQTILDAFSIRDRIIEIRIKIKLVEQELFDKPTDEKALLRYKTFCSLEVKYITKYDDLMNGFFVSPKERLKGLVLFNQTEKTKDAIDAVFE